MKKQEITELIARLQKDGYPFLVMIVDDEDGNQMAYGAGATDTDIANLFESVFQIKPQLEHLVKGVLTARIIERAKMQEAKKTRGES